MDLHTIQSHEFRHKTMYTQKYSSSPLMNSLQFSWYQCSRTEGVVCAGVIADRVLYASSGASDDVCKQKQSQDTGFICLAWRAAQGSYYKAKHGFDNPNTVPYFFCKPSVVDWLCVTRTQTTLLIRYGRPSCFFCTEGAGVGSKPSTARRPLSRFDTHPRWPPVTQSLRTEP